MKRSSMKNIPFLLLLASLVAYVASLLIFKSDLEYSQNRTVFFLFLISLLFTFFSWLISFKQSQKLFAPVGFLNLFYVSLAAVITRVIFLINYPFVSVGDELRDGGLYAQHIASNTIKNVFDYGRYDAHGLIISSIASVFYGFFGASVLTYRIPAMLISILDITLLYFLLSQVTKNKVASFLGAATLISLPLHLFYSRTEIVVILSSLFSTLLLTTLYFYFRRKMVNVYDYILLGLIIGFTFNLHAAIKAYSLIILVVLIIIGLFLLFSKRLNIRQFSVRIALLILFVFVGFGPTLLKTHSFDLFFHTSRLTLESNQKVQLDINPMSVFGERYLKSLLVWVYEPTTAWYPDHRPIFSPILFLLMISGIVFGFVRKNALIIMVFFVTLGVHFTNSSLTNMINGDHRLSPLFPVGSLFVGIGVSFLLANIRKKLLQNIAISALVLLLFFQTVQFFIMQPANKNKPVLDYLSMHAIYFIKSDLGLHNGSPITLLVSSFNFEKLNNLHHKEQYEFFFPNVGFNFERDAALKNNELRIRSKEKAQGKTYSYICEKASFYCPIGYEGKIVIHY